MKQVIQNLKNGTTEVIEVPIPQTRPGTILVQTAASLVSAGTERNLVEFAEKGLIGKARSRPDLFKQVVEKAKREGVLTTLESAFHRLDTPMLLGYSSAGIVLETGKGTSGFQPGQRVVCAGGGHAVHAEFAVIPQNLAAHLPDRVSFEEGAFSTLGAIALNGIRLANLQIGESVAVIGLGLLGMITAQLAQAGGCIVYGSDIQTSRLKFAKTIGISAQENQRIRGNYLSLTRGKGFDVVLICADTPSDETVELAGIIARDRGYVISLGVVGLNLPRKSFFEKELFFQVSRSSGPGRYDPEYEEEGTDYPIGYVRWTEGRNLEAFVDLLDSGKLNIQPMITHKFPIEKAADAYSLVTGKTNEDYLGVLLTYPEKTGKPQTILQMKKGGEIDTKKDSETIRLGVIGAGNYANAVFLPAVKKAGEVALIGIAASSGISAQHSAKKFGFSFATANSEDVIKHDQINTVAILTRHNTHAEFTMQALRNGKHVYCEKPLGIKIEEIQVLEKELKKKDPPNLMVGFNRRFAPFSQSLRDYFNKRTEPVYMHYRINAGYLPPTHWLNDPQIGGGRLIGECCHFIDFACFLIGQLPNRVFAVQMPNNGKYSGDNIQVTLRFPDGSIGNIAYLANGSKRFKKEYIEIFCEGKVGILDDFRSLKLINSEKKHHYRSYFTQNKGHQNAWRAFRDSIIHHSLTPIALNEIIYVSYTVLAADLSLRSGAELDIPEFIHTA